MANCPAGDLGRAGRIILISSTYGDGEPADNGRFFWECLAEESATRLEHLSYAVPGWPRWGRGASPEGWIAMPAMSRISAFGLS